MNRKAPPAAAPLIAITIALLATACGSERAQGPQTTRAATKETCSEAVLQSDLVALDRVLVPFTPELLGVETTWGNEEVRVVLVSGGYLDDIFEAYDDLEPVGETEIRGEEATILVTTFLGRPVWAATWSENEEPPCDAHAILSIGLDELQFQRQLQSIR